MPHFPKSELMPNEKKEQDDWMYETFIGPLEKFGFKLEYASSYGDSDLTGFHMIRMNLPEESDLSQNSLSLEDETWKAIFAITDQDDDNQPHATHRYYNGDLWIFIPYYC